MTDTDPVFLPALPAPCCAAAPRLVQTWVDAMTRRDVGASMAAERAWVDHQLDVHRMIGTPTAGCVDCAEWIAVLELEPGTDPVVTTITGREAADHFVRHWVVDPVITAEIAWRLDAGPAAASL